ncbi:MAG: hypothetical protein Q9227_008105 [Pyrenula ochraceoflavens]
MPSTARSMRARSKAISYTEPTTSDDSEYDVLSQSTKRSRRLACHNISYQETASEEDSDNTSLPPPAKQPRRSARRSAKHQETDSEDDSTVPGTESKAARVDLPLRFGPNARWSGRQSGLKQNHHTQGKTSGRQRSHRPRMKISTRLMPVQPGALSLPPIGRIPQWATLPYEILTEIFRYAAYPLYDGLRPCPSINWLLDISLLSKSFHEPAISTLLRSPPIYPVDRAHQLLAMLRNDVVHTIRFGSKIKRLDVEVRSLLIRKSGINLSEMIRLLPGLQHLTLYHNHDYFGSATWAQPSNSHAKWSYPEELFNALDETGICLRSWTWNGRFPNTFDVARLMASRHRRPAFCRLRALTLFNLASPAKALEDTEVGVVNQLAEGVSELAELEQLEFVNCLVVNRHFLSELPRRLRSLIIVNCDKLDSSALEEFLVRGGERLENLRLDGNKSLDLGFLSSLAGFCPNLAHLRMDLSYSDGSAFHDVNPRFDELLPSGSPSWPTHIQTVDLLQLRNMDADAAEDFLQSLVDAAPRLQSLRSLNLKLILNLGWRERSGIRTKWSSRLEHVFLRRSVDPSPDTVKGTGILRTTKPLPRGAAKSELARPSSSGSISSTPSGDADALPSKRKSTRIAQAHSDLAKSRSVNEDFSGGQNFVKSRSRDLPVQGMCTFVKLAVDNQRPSEVQLTEANFMDEEPEDEDWNGRDLEPKTRYAW